MDSEFRPLDIRERALLEKLLEIDFPGRDALRGQLGGIRAKQIEDDGTLRLRCTSGVPAVVKYRLVSEGTCADADCVQISVLLHVNKHGFMCMLEIIKVDGSPIITPPSADNVTVLT
jgi:hypothetical protein